MKESPFFSEVYAKNLDIAVNHILKRNLDWFHVIDGPVGSGKSTLGVETALYVDPTFTESRVAYSFQDVQAIVEELGEPPESIGKAILWDEAAEGQYSQDFAKAENKEVTKFFFRVRKKRLFFVNCLPHVWNLQSSSRLRVMSLAHCVFTLDEEEGLLNQGKLEFYSIFKIPTLIKYKSYECVKPDFSARFKAAPKELWNLIQEKNFDFINETDANAILKVKRINQFELDKAIAELVKNELGDKQSTLVRSADLLPKMVAKYSTQAWLTLRFISKKLRGYGFEKYTAGQDRSESVYIVTRTGVNNLLKELKLSQLRTENKETKETNQVI